MEFVEVVELLGRRPGMLTGEESFGAIGAFLVGYNLARDGGPLAGFQEWLIVRANGYGNSHWRGIVKHLTLGSRATVSLTPEENEACWRELIRLLLEFLAYREEKGLVRVYYDYALWLRRRGLLQGEPPKTKRKKSK